jgi:HlyD family secretion protein
VHPDPLRRLVRSLCKAAEPPGGERPGDAELLARFVARRDEAAFELLLWRHGPMVLAVCRRLLRHEDDAEDAFQATFLALVRKAGSIAQGEAVGGWLYRVAYRVALRARTARTRREHREQAGVELVAAAPEGDSARDEFRQVLDQEVDRLPARQRTAFILCCLEGKTGDEAARQLGCSPGTVSSRLTRARQRLRSRLARRGLAPSVGALAAVLAGETSATTVSSSLVDSTLKAALIFASGKTAAGVLSGRAVTLAEGVLRTMFLTRVRVAALLLLVAGLLVAGGVLTRHALDAAPPAEAQGGKSGAKHHDGPVVVHVIKPQTGGLERLTRVSGDIHAFEKVEVTAAVSGQLKAQAVDIGDRVKKGQLLAEIDAPLLVLEEKQAAVAIQQAKGAVREAEARLVTARAEVEAGESGIARAEVAVQAATAAVSFRQREQDRAKVLLQTKSVEQPIVDEKGEQLEAARGQLAVATVAVKTAKADLAVQKSKVAQAEAGMESARAALEAAQVHLEKAQYTRSLTRIVAPVDGVVTGRNYSDGQYLQPGGQGTAVPFLTVQRMDRVRVVTQVPESDIPLVHPGIPVELTFPSLPDVRFPGLTVTRIGFAEDPSTRTMRVEIDVPNPTNQLRPGMFGQATLHLGPGAPEALRVPVSALVANQGAFAVYVVRDGKAQRTPVNVGTTDKREMAVVSGLKPDDLVVTDPIGLKGEVVPVKVSDKPGK